MRVNFFATLRDRVGAASAQVNLKPGSTVQDLIERLVAENPGLETDLVDEGGSLRSYLKMFINGREVVYLEDQFEHVLEPTDIVDIFPPVGGG
jgi:MoaD family protein